MKILWVAPRWPEPANDGARIATLELLRYLKSEADFQITLLAIVPKSDETPPIPDLKLQEIHIIRRRIPKGSHALRFLRNPLVPVTFSSFTDADLKRSVRTIMEKSPWDWVIFDGMHAAIPFPAPTTQIAYRAHNVEFNIWERAAQVARFPRKQALIFQARLVRRFEEALLRRCDVVLPVSDDDAKVFHQLVEGLKQEVIRIGQCFPEVPPERGQSSGNSAITLGFIGRLDWMPNRHGLDWFLKEVWPAVSLSHPAIRLKIAGSGDGSWLDHHRELAGIQFLGKVPSVESFYSEIDAAIVPLFVGSGTRVKVIESSRYAVPCISTSLGVEGCPLAAGISYVQAESAKEWIGVIQTTARPGLCETGNRAFNAMKSLYDSALIARKLAIRLRSGD